MSVPRLILAGVEPGPALDLVAGALLAGFGEQRATRGILLGFDLPLWRLVYDVAARAPRALDPALHPAPVADELFDQWSERMDLALVIGVRPLLDKWEGVNGSRAADLARRLDAPVVLVLDARGRGASAAAAVYGTRALAEPARDRRRGARRRRRLARPAPSCKRRCAATSACRCSARSRRS